MHRLLNTLGICWAAIFFIGTPIFFTYILFLDQLTSISPRVIVLFVVTVFISSFSNVFLKHKEFRVLPQVLKMLLSIYVTIVGFAAVYKQAGLVSGSEVLHDASASLYFSIVTWTTLGYGDFQPSESVRWLAALEAFLGTLFIPAFLAAIIFTLQLKQSHNK